MIGEDGDTRAAAAEDGDSRSKASSVPSEVPGPTSAIVTTGLTRRFGSLTAVDRIDLRVPRGSFYGFLGPNGAGKTTCLRMLTGLLPPSEGDALIEGLSIRREGVAIKRLIGVVPDDLALFDRLSLWEHLTMAGPLYGLTREETARRAGDLLRVLDLWDERGVYAVDCSHGMRKKLALALALIHRPSVLFLDEPFEGIDPIAGRSVRALLSKLTQRGATVFLTSHILEIISALADHVAIISQGKIVREGSLAELRRSGETLEEIFIEAVDRSEEEEEPDLSWLLSR